MSDQARYPITIVSRESQLARLQVEEILKLCPKLKAQCTFLKTFGDKNPDISLLTNTQEDIFTDTLDQAVLEGKADISIHSAKDLPVPLRNGLDVLALTLGEDPSDSLVSKKNTPLAKLPPGANIGTSSPIRKENLANLRPDLTCVSIRGTIQERLTLVDEGKIDGLIVATCALKRLGLSDRISEVLPFTTHPMQGKLAVVGRRDSADLRAFFQRIDARRSFRPGSPEEKATINAEIPLSRQKVLYLGLDPKAISLPEKLVPHPLIETSFLNKKISDMENHDAILFTSKTAVRAFFEKNNLTEQKIFAIGPSTAAEVEKFNHKPDFLPKTSDSDSMVETIEQTSFSSILYPCSDLSNNDLHALENVKPIVFYKTAKKHPPKKDLSAFTGVVFSSASTIDAFMKIYETIPPHLVCFVFGIKSAERLETEQISPWRVITIAPQCPTKNSK